jgi:hypothetical protein
VLIASAPPMRAYRLACESAMFMQPPFDDKNQPE